jgi:acyl carrier protein
MSTLERLQAIILKDFEVQPEDIKPDALLENLGVDSMGLVDLMFNVEDEFQIMVSREPVEFKTLQDVVDYIDQLVAQQHSEKVAEETTS